MAACFKDKSLRPLFATDTSFTDLDQEFAFLVSGLSTVLCGNAERVLGISERSYLERLETLGLTLRTLLPTTEGYDRNLLSSKLMRLATVTNEFTTYKISCGLKRAPFAIECYGLSSQGKTTFLNQLVDCLLHSADLPLDRKYRDSHNASDKFWSNWTSDKTVLIFDDFANDRAQFAERVPTREIINVCNNDPYYANKADLDSKGKCYVEPEIVGVTTNVKDLDAFQYSNCPYSIQRRMHLVITVTAKPEFQYAGGNGNQGIDSSKVIAWQKEHPDAPCDDIWTLTVERAVEPRNIFDLATYEVVEYNGKLMQNVSMAEVVAMSIDKFSEHRRQQEEIVHRMLHRSDRLTRCGVDGCRHISGYCPHHSGQSVASSSSEFENQIGPEILSLFSLRDCTSKPENNRAMALRIAKFAFSSQIDILSAEASYASLIGARYLHKYVDWVKFIPLPILDTGLGRTFFLFTERKAIVKTYMKYTILLWSSFAFISLLLPFSDNIG
jgi:hypothetical protein